MRRWRKTWKIHFVVCLLSSPVDQLITSSSRHLKIFVIGVVEWHSIGCEVDPRFERLSVTTIRRRGTKHSTSFTTCCGVYFYFRVIQSVDDDERKCCQQLIRRRKIANRNKTGGLTASTLIMMKWEFLAVFSPFLCLQVAAFHHPKSPQLWTTPFFFLSHAELYSELISQSRCNFPQLLEESIRSCIAGDLDFLYSSHIHNIFLPTFYYC